MREGVRVDVAHRTEVPHDLHDQGPYPNVVSVEGNRSFVEMLNLEHVASGLDLNEDHCEEGTKREGRCEKGDVPVLDDKFEVVLEVVILWLENFLEFFFSD